MSDVTIQKFTAKQREQIRWMYLGSHEITDISAKLNIEIDTVRFLVFGLDGTGKDKGCLYQEKKSMGNAAIVDYLMDKAQKFEKICGTAANILAKTLMNLQVEVDNGKELTMDEMSKLAGIITSMDKIIRLESGLATETIEYKGLSMAEAREILQNDPFAPKDVEGEVVQVLPWLADE